MQRFVSEPLRLPPPDGVPFQRADLELVGVEKAGPSFVLEVFVGNPEATEGTPRAITSGWAGTMPVFAHGDCWGDQGHCDPPRGPLNQFDLRPPHPLTPVNLSMEITLALRFLGLIEHVVVTILAREARPDIPERKEILRFKELMLVTYDP
jgi:tyrosinase